MGLTLAILLGVSTGPLARAGSCGAELAPVFECDHGFSTCFDDVLSLLGDVKARGADLSQVEVLLLSRFGMWTEHVVVRSGSLIYDPWLFPRFGAPGLERSRVMGVPISEYFLSAPIHEDSRALPIPAVDYLQNYRDPSPYRKLLEREGIVVREFLRPAS